MQEQIIQKTLKNGLKVLLKEIHTAPIISHWIWYRVGSKDEHPGKTGISHWIEHMQFKGTLRYPSNVLDKAISREGGYWNAFTYIDWTAYFETMPAEKIDLCLDLEADRMVNSLFSPKEVELERSVILSEREGAENQPLFLLGEAVQKAQFRIHPYHNQVIGEKTDLISLKRDDLLKYYHSYYIPTNAVVTIAGDFNTEAMLNRISEAYGKIPSALPPERKSNLEPPPDDEYRLTVEGPGETSYLQISYRAPAGRDSDFFQMTVLDSLLCGPSNLNVFGGGGISNKTSRLYRHLVEQEYAVSVGGYLSATTDPYMYTITITIHPQRQVAEVLTAFDDEIANLQDELVSMDEISRAAKQARAIFAYGTENITNQAFWMGYAEMFSSYAWFTNYLGNLASVTPVSLQNCARTYLQPKNRIIGTYLPNAGSVQ